jgi:hypothetical protein
MTTAIQQAAADKIGKHRRLLRTGRDGRILSALMLPLLSSGAPAGYGVLTTIGRKTGKSRRKCVRVLEAANTPTSWPSADERGQARSLLCDTVFPNDYGECALHLRRWPTRTKIQELHRYWFETGIPVAIDLKEHR